MAEHLRNELARRLIPVRPSRILTLAQFLDRVGTVAATSKIHLHTLIEQTLDHLQPERFRHVAGYRGFRFAVAALLEETDRGGLPADLARIAEEVERALASLGIGLRNARLRAAARLVFDVPRVIVFDGFFTFSNAELDLIASLAKRARVVDTLPEWLGSAGARSRLVAAGFAETTLTEAHRAPLQEAFSTATLEQECEEIARRILDEAAQGRAFREMGIVLRVREPYAAALATTFARFGIPARFYFADPLSSHPAIQFLSGIVRALLGGWEHAELLRVLRMPVSGIGATPGGDRFDFEVRASLPGRGLPLAGLPEPFASVFAAVTLWTRDRTDAVAWAARIKRLRGLVPRPVVEAAMVNGSIGEAQMRAWWSTARLLDAFDVAIDEAAATFADSAQLLLAEFWSRCEVALELNELRLPDRRRDVVHVIDVFEARQWELPIVFVCGMVERHFPQYHREDPLLDDADRRRAGLQTSIELQRQERSLFQLATSRATERTILSYSRFDEKGDPALPSFFLAEIDVVPRESRIRPHPARSVPDLPASLLRDSDVLEHVATLHRTLSPSSIERFLQCPFQFFAEKSLKLRLRPPAPRDRLDMLVQGSIIHASIAALEEMPLLGAANFDAVFEAEREKRLIPGGYRTEAVRLEMLRNFSAFLTEKRDALGWPARVEEKFEIVLSPELTVRGRIDRLEVGPHREALVIDYKYSAANKIRERVKDQDKGDVVQAGLYLLAAVKQFGLVPAGMLYCGLRKDVEWGGWHLPLPGLEKIGESCTVTRLEELTAAAQQKALDVFASITSGDIEVRPADEKKCAWCDYRDMCRVDAR